MKPYDPNTFAHDLPIAHRQFVQSVNSVLNSNVDMGVAVNNAPSSAGVNAGVYTQFNQGNGSGKLIRIAANGDTTQNADYNWGATGTGIVINHGLKNQNGNGYRQPIGFHVVDSDGPIQAYRTAPPDENQITIAPSDNSKSVTIYVF
jgi:hypothetical protein